jgi:elongation factor P
MYSYFADPMYVFMDADYKPVRGGKGQHGRGSTSSKTACRARVVFYDERPISVELPNSGCEILYTEPAIRHFRKGAQTGENQPRLSVQVPLFATGDARSRSTPAR